MTSLGAEASLVNTRACFSSSIKRSRSSCGNEETIFQCQPHMRFVNSSKGVQTDLRVEGNPGFPRVAMVDNVDLLQHSRVSRVVCSEGWDDTWIHRV
jgi:hypothetical protein